MLTVQVILPHHDLHCWIVSHNGLQQVDGRIMDFHSETAFFLLYFYTDTLNAYINALSILLVE